MCILHTVLDSLTYGVAIWQLNESNPFDYKRIKLVYANKPASKITGKQLETEIGSTIKLTFPEWYRMGYGKRFVQAYFEKNRLVMFDKFEQMGVQSDEMYTIKCYPAENRHVMVIFQQIEIPQTIAVDSYNIENLEIQTMRLLGNYHQPYINTKHDKKRSITW